MSALNQCNFIGRLGQKPELKYGNNETPICKISIAITDTWKNKQSGQQEEQTEWVNIVAFNRLAEVMAEFLDVGSLVYISGKMKTTKYQDKEGVDRWSTEIIANMMKMLSSKSEGGSKTKQSTPKVTQVDDAPLIDDDIPF
jgi:single-strand DNA-binding protein